MQYKVEYYGETPSDNQLIGVYDNKPDANAAKMAYIKWEIGYSSLLEFKKDKPSADQDDIEEFLYEYDHLMQAVDIEPVHNMFTFETTPPIKPAENPRQIPYVPFERREELQEGIERSRRVEKKK